MVFRKKYLIRVILVSVILVAISLYFILDLGTYFNLSYLKVQQQAIAGYYAAHPVLFPFMYFLGYVLMAALSIPGAAVMTLAAGAIFGLVTGIVVVSFASAIGASLAFLISRYLLKELIHDHHRDRFRLIDEGIDRDGGYYLFTLRLVPLFPFFIINLVMGITTIRLSTFYWVSQLGMLPFTIVFVNAGKQLGEIESLGDILSADIFIAFVIVGLFPLLTRLTIEWIERRRNRQPNE